MDLPQQPMAGDIADFEVVRKIKSENTALPVTIPTLYFPSVIHTCLCD
jgi:hypothetical protein